MRKCLFIVVMLLASAAFAQITSGTIIILNFTKDRLVIAADSRGVNTDTWVPHDNECKIAEVDHRLIFTSVGNARRGRSSGLDRVNGWDNAETTRVAFRSVRLLPTEEAQTRTIAKAWADTIAAHWQSLYQSEPDKVTRVLSKNGGLTVGAFAEANKGTIYFRAAQIRFDRSRATAGDPIGPEFIERLSDCWDCGEGNRICAMGKHFDVAARFCAQTKSSDKIKVRTQLKSANRSVKLAVKIAELTVDAYEKTPGDVGGMVDAVTLKNNGSITWNAIKDGCEDSQQ
jgi:hypothetical protein